MGGVMTRKELDKHLNIIKAHRNNVDNYIHAVKQLSEGIAIDYSYDIECAYIKLVSELAGDTGAWIDWYIISSFVFLTAKVVLVYIPVYPTPIVTGNISNKFDVGFFKPL